MQRAAAGERFRLTSQLSDCFFLWPGSAGAGRGPQQLLRLAATAAQPRPRGPGERQPSRLSTRPCLNGTAASTAHHASIKSSGPLASSWAAIATAPHALFSAQGQDQTRVQALSEHRQPGQWCGREPAAAEVQPHRGWFAFRRRRLKKFPIKVCKTSKEGAGVAAHVGTRGKVAG